MKKVTLIFPFIGNISKAHIYALNQLGRLKNANIIFITDERTNSLLKKNKLNIEIKLIDSIFNYNNTLNISINDIIDSPYKLCDYKPFYDLLFNIPLNDYWGFGDLDCIYNTKVIDDKLQKINNPHAIYGDRGHFTVLGFKASMIMQKFLIQKINEFKSKKIDLLSNKKNYALDEFHFLHVACHYLEAKKEIKWERDFFKPLLDVDYKNIIPKNILKDQEYSFSTQKVYINEKESNISYIHLQKREVIIDNKITSSINYLSFSPVNGNAIYSSSKLLYPKAKHLHRLIYFLRILLKRIKYRIKNHSFKKRPSLKGLKYKNES
ncbi:DUF6625 family protein [Providencia alcalifaciens]|uniref:Putative glycosyltransferase n=1 Tax=Providencia stuartii TaxID=588 RepID=A0A346CLF6_PROST|nr:MULTISPECIES: DUF6625 family protein [Providencia]AXL96430.1 putative glycosyltransferase [Providencia stuartii]QLQ97467.1 hypothetical protein H0910_18325 [Providencia alcalifaciens]